MKISLRQHKLKAGRVHLYLDYYPPRIDPVKCKQTGYENLKLFLYGHARGRGAAEAPDL